MTGPHDQEQGERRSFARFARRSTAESWRVAILNDAYRLRRSLAMIDPATVPVANRSILDEVAQAIDSAIEIADGAHGNGWEHWWQRVWGLWNKAGFETALAALGRANEALLLVQPSELVMARLPELRASVKARIRVSDPRFDLFVQVLDDLTKQAGALIVEEAPEATTRAASTQVTEASETATPVVRPRRPQPEADR